MADAALAQLLDTLSLGQFLTNFTDEQIDMEAFHLLSEDDLTELGLPSSVRQRLLAARDSPAPPPAPPPSAVPAAGPSQGSTAGGAVALPASGGGTGTAADSSVAKTMAKLSLQEEAPRARLEGTEEDLGVLLDFHYFITAFKSHSIPVVDPQELLEARSNHGGSRVAERVVHAS